jgi:hypothetical protein
VTYTRTWCWRTQQATASGTLAETEALADTCMADYDVAGWRGADYRDGDDISIPGQPHS